MTRAEVSGAILALNATNTKNRAAVLRPILAAKLGPKAVERVLADLKSYPEWAARMDLEETRSPKSPRESVADTTYRGVFTLEELLAMGQTGDTRQDWLKGGPNRVALNTKLKFPAGYYRIDANQAVYVDPKSGSIPQQFFDMLDPATGDLKRDPVSGMPSAYLQDNHVWQEPSVYADMRKGLDAQRALEAQGLTPQQAQDRRIGAQPRPAPDTYKPGVHNSIGASAGAYDRFKGLGGTDDLLNMPKFEGYDPARAAGLRDNLAEAFMQRAGAQGGLRDLRAAQGLDPATGTSQAEMERLRSTYEALDPAKRSQWLFYQDPANLTPELRAARLESRRGERELIAQTNQYAAEHRYAQQGGQGRSYEFIVKKGDVSQTDALGREKFYGGVPLKAEMVKGKYDRFGDVGRRLGGGLAGGFLGFVGGGGLGAAMGAYQGAGGPMPQVGGYAGLGLGAAVGAAMGGWAGAALGGYMGAGGAKGIKSGGFNDFKGFGNWRGSGAQIPGGKELGSAILFARMRQGPRGSHPAGTSGRKPMQIMA
jgi:hypothetical protein